jgi:hypothetical protein
MRLIPPEDSPLGEVEKAPLTLMWSPEGHTNEYVLRLPIVTEADRSGDMLPDRYAEFLSEDLFSDGHHRWQVTNIKDGCLVVNTLPEGDHNHDQVMAAAQRLLQFAVQAEPQITLPRE